MSRKPPQPDLFALAAAAQQRVVKAEDERVYRAVLALRAAGWRVYRAGRRDSFVNGRRLPNTALPKLAAVVDEA
jgi:hypothetical protein